MRFTQTALDEIESVLEGTLAYGGAAHTRKVRRRFARLFSYLDDGIGLGTSRLELGLDNDIRFIPTPPYPFVVVVDRRERLVLRILYARSDYRDLVIADWFPA